MDDLLKWRDNYIKLGFIPIPVGTHDKDHAGKAPCISGFQKLTKEDKVDWSQAKNIGILCGPYEDGNGFVCLDIDKKDRGMEIFSSLSLPDL